MKLSNNIVRSFLLTATVAGACAAGSATAASACKGLDNAACNSGSNCSWVAGYERKDGRKVSAFCRTSSAAKRTAKAKTDKASTKQSD